MQWETGNGVITTKIIGITGPTGAGKTTALQEVRRLGGCVIDCDAVYHNLLEQDEKLQEALERQFGPLRDKNGAIDRKKLGAIVFQDPEKLELLNHVAQRATVVKTRQLIEECEQQNCPLAAIDAIALLESGLNQLCHTTIAVLAPPEVRVRRIMNREGISEEYAWSRVRAQKPEEFFSKNCDYVLQNNGTAPEEFRGQVQALLQRILSGTVDLKEV